MSHSVRSAERRGVEVDGQLVSVAGARALAVKRHFPFEAREKNSRCCIAGLSHSALTGDCVLPPSKHYVGPQDLLMAPSTTCVCSPFGPVQRD